MTLKEFAKRLDGRQYGNEITKEEEALAKKLGFVVVFGYSDDCAELRGAIDDELDCFDGGVLEHDDLPDTIYADWCPEDIDCSWAYGTSIPHERFYIYEDDELYCVGIVCDINAQKIMADREKLIELLDEATEKLLDMAGGLNNHNGNDVRADHLIANGVTVQRWIPVTERLPEHQHDWVLVACEFVPEGGYGVPHIAELRHGVWYADCYEVPLEDAGCKVTHWMPMTLPEPPKEE